MGMGISFSPLLFSMLLVKRLSNITAGEFFFAEKMTK
jgi:hypothetical protein